jgi:hypothetical protein
MVPPASLFRSIVCLFAVYSAAHARAKDEESGVKNPSTISVRVSGGGVRKPGLYHIDSGATLRDLLANDKAEWLKISNRIFQITRVVQGKRSTFEVDYQHWDIKLLDGDTVYAPTIGTPGPRPTRP